MGLSLLSFTTAVNNAAAAAQAACSSILDFTVGSPFRALLEANASLALWVQWCILQVLALTRAATSTSSDLDSWMADFSFTRLPGVVANGSATFSRYSATIAALLPIGTQVKTVDGSQTFVVTVDSTNALWNLALNGYLIPSGTYSVTVPVASITQGVAGNIQAGTLTLIASAVAGIDTVTNASAFTAGAAPETDAAFLARFAVYIAGLRDSTLAGIEAAIESVQSGIVFSIHENADASGAYDVGMVTVFIDDGSGSPSGTLVSRVGTAVTGARACGIRTGVYACTSLTANVAMAVTAASGFTLSAVEAAVQTALAAYINAQEFGPTLGYVALGTAASGVPGVASVTAGYTLNGGTVDVTATIGQVFRAGTITVT